MKTFQRTLALLVMGAGMTLAGCTAPAATVATAGQAAVQAAQPVAAQPAVMKIKALDFSYELPADVPSGYVTIVMENAGQEAHHAQLLRLNDGVTPDQFFAAAQKSDAEALALATLPGGPGPIEPGTSQTVTLDLAPGIYVLICLLPSHDGMTHLQKGMVATFTVTEPSDQAPATPEPVAQGTARLLDFSFVLPQQIAAGKQVWKIANDGKQAHELSLIKLAPGKTMQDVMAWAEHMHGAPPYTNAGGMQAIMPGTAAWLDLDLTPGQYVALCHVPDVASGKPHEMLGMVMPFTVQ